MEILFALCFARFPRDRQMCLMWSATRRKLKSREINDGEDESPRFSEIEWVGCSRTQRVGQKSEAVLCGEEPHCNDWSKES
jgi:hypothetical protein